MKNNKPVDPCKAITGENTRLSYTYHTWVTRLKKKGLLETAATVPTVVINEPMQALYDSFGEVKLSFKASIKWK